MEPEMKTDTAHRAWNVKWSSIEGRADWLAAEQIGRASCRERV